jgi:sterol carrier protein 2
VTEYSIQALMEKVVRAFQPEKAAGIDAKVQFHLTGSQGGDWVALVRDQKLVVEPGVTADPDLEFGADTQDVLDVFSGKLDPMQAYLQGRVKFKGDMGLAYRLVGMFRRPG